MHVRKEITRQSHAAYRVHNSQCGGGDDGSASFKRAIYHCMQIGQYHNSIDLLINVKNEDFIYRLCSMGN